MSKLLSFFYLLGCSLPLFGQTVPSTANPNTLSNDDVYLLSTAMATGKPPSSCIAAIHNDAQVAATTNDKLLLQNHLSFLTDKLCTTYLLLSSDQFKKAIRGARIEANGLTKDSLEKVAVKKLKSMSQQNGSSSGTGGSTNVTSKGLASKILSVGSEYGALTQSVSGQTTTAQGSFAGVPLVLLGKGVLVDCKTKIFAVTPCINHRAVDYLTGLSYSVSFETSSNSTTATGTAVGGNSGGTTQAVNVTANNRSINGFSVKWAAIYKKPTGEDLESAHKKVQASSVVDALDSAVNEMENFQIGAGRTYQAWKTQKGDLLNAAVEVDKTGYVAEQLWETLGTSFAEALGVSANIDEASAAKSPVLEAALKLGETYNAYLGTEESIGAAIVKPPVLSFEYDDNRPASQPSNSVIRGIYQAKWSPLTLTVNGALSFYDSDQSGVPGAGRLRDVQFASEGAHDFNLKTPFSEDAAVTLSGAFYFQYQSSPSILNVTPGNPVAGVTFTGLPSTATKIYAEKGNISLGQLKLTIGSGSSVTVPLSVTYSNRTELVTKPTWKAQIGISYDFDSIFSGNK